MSTWQLRVVQTAPVALMRWLQSEQRQINVVDNLSVVEAGHQLKFGADYRWLAPFSIPISYRQFVQFTGMGTAPG